MPSDRLTVTTERLRSPVEASDVGRPRASRRNGLSEGFGQDDFVAAVDLGTNNCRMLVARPFRRGFKVVDSFSRITRLGQGVSSTRLLSAVAIERTLDALRVCAEKLARRPIAAGRYVATEACRQALNCDAFIERVHSETGIALEIIDAEEEARLALTGCASLLEGKWPYALVFDIGGGSTELILAGVRAGRAPRILGVASLPIGVVTLAEELGEGAVCHEAYRALVDRTLAMLRPFDRRHRIGPLVQRGVVQMLGVSGTVTTLGGIHLDLPRYDRRRVDGQRVAFTDLEAVIRKLFAMSPDERAAQPCIGVERADLVLAGCAILEAIQTLWPVGSLRIGDRGVREGLLLDLIRNGRQPGVPVRAASA